MTETERRTPLTDEGEVGDKPDAVCAGTLRCGDMTLVRLGFGAAKLTGPGIWGPPPDPGEAVRVLRRAADLGVNLFDTADSYGPHVSEELVRRALHPFRDVFIATKGGCVHPRPDEWAPLGDPAYLRQSCEMSLRRLGVEALDLYQLHEVDPRVPFEDQLGTLIELRSEGKIRHIGLSAVSPEQLERALALTGIASVQGEFNLLNRVSLEIMRRCQDRDVVFIPFFPLADGVLARADGPLAELARAWGAKPAQLALAWLLNVSETALPIPGTRVIAELEENVSAGKLRLDDASMRMLDRVASSADGSTPVG